MFLIMAEPKTKCIFRSFKVDESFWTKKQSCKFSKVDIKKWCPFFDFVCFNGRHILKGDDQLFDRWHMPVGS